MPDVRRVIWKQLIPNSQSFNSETKQFLTDPFPLQHDAKPLQLGLDLDGKLCFWFETTASGYVAMKRICAVWTGGAVPEGIYLGSRTMKHEDLTDLVYHLYLVDA